MEKYSAKVFENVRHECSLIILTSLPDLGIIKQSKFTCIELNKTKIKL